MPWTKSSYPDSMKNLPAPVRNKAVEMANALLKENMDEGIAIATSISKAKDWAANRGKKTGNPQKSKTTDRKTHGQDRYVIPYENQWAIKIEGNEKVAKKFSTKKEAVSQARKETKEINGSLTIQKKTGQVEKRISYNPGNSKNKN